MEQKSATFRAFRRQRLVVICARRHPIERQIELILPPERELGRATEARAVLRELHEQAGEEYVFPDYIASAHAGLGEAAAALEWLERAYEERSSRMIVLGVDPMFASVRGDVRFTHLAQQLRVQL